MSVTSLQFFHTGPGHVREGFCCVDGISSVFSALHVEAIVTEFDCKSAEEDEEEHDEHPLASSCVHVEPLRHQGEVCSR